MNLRTARHENEIAKGFCDFNNIPRTEIKIENDFAREMEGERGWDYLGFNIVRVSNENEIKTIGGSRRTIKFKYLVFTWVGGGVSMSYMEPPDDPEPLEIDSFEFFDEALFAVKSLIDLNGFRAKMEADYWNKDAERQREMDLLDPGCRDCGKDSQGCVYCDDCASNKRCPHDNPIGDCASCDFAADLAFDAARGI